MRVLAVISLLNVFPLAAQKSAYKGTITANPIRLEQKGEFLHVDMDVILDRVKVNSPRAVEVIPQLTALDQSLTLPRVSVKGRNNYKVYERMMLLKGKDKQQQEIYRIRKAYRRTNDTIPYRFIIPYENWMADAKLDIHFDECGCGDTTLMKINHLISKVTLEHIPVPYQIMPHLAYLQPAIEKVKEREIQAECFLDFEVNKVNIRPEYMNNPKELAKIHIMIDELKADPSITINQLNIIGYASPEGTLQGNKRLSEGRAKALRDYMLSKYEFPSAQYNIVYGGENWQGLSKTLETLDIEYKSEIQDIIDNTDSPNERKVKLIHLRGGAPYYYLLKNIYPQLRVAICKVDFNIKNFNVDEAREIIKTKPQNLSLNEMFQVANSYPVGSQEFNEVFETAVRMFPDDETANLNAAAASLIRKDLISAERYLERISEGKQLPEYINTLGTLALLKGEYDRAEELLQKAADMGIEAAKQNLEELTKKKENIAEIESKIRRDK